jgi:hypothetical protein
MIDTISDIIVIIIIIGFHIIMICGININIFEFSKSRIGGRWGERRWGWVCGEVKVDMAG